MAGKASKRKNRAPVKLTGINGGRTPRPLNFDPDARLTFTLPASHNGDGKITEKPTTGHAGGSKKRWNPWATIGRLLGVSMEKPATTTGKTGRNRINSAEN